MNREWSMRALMSGLQPWRRHLLVLVLFTAPAVAASDGAVNEGELTNLVLQDCGSCHGMTLRGGLGPPLRPENLSQRSPEVLAAIIREGVPGTAMPPWKALLSEPEIHWISERLKSGALIKGQQQKDQEETEQEIP